MAAKGQTLQGVCCGTAPESRLGPNTALIPKRNPVEKAAPAAGSRNGPAKENRAACQI